MKKKKLELEVIVLRNNSDSERNGSHVLFLLLCQNWKMINKKEYQPGQRGKRSTGKVGEGLDQA